MNLDSNQNPINPENSEPPKNKWDIFYTLVFVISILVPLIFIMMFNFSMLIMSGFDPGDALEQLITAFTFLFVTFSSILFFIFSIYLLTKKREWLRKLMIFIFLLLIFLILRYAYPFYNDLGIEGVIIYIGIPVCFLAMLFTKGMKAHAQQHTVQYDSKRNIKLLTIFGSVAVILVLFYLGTYIVIDKTCGFSNPNECIARYASKLGDKAIKHNDPSYCQQGKTKEIVFNCYQKVLLEYRDISICDDVRLIAESNYEDCLWRINFNNGVDTRRKTIETSEMLFLFCDDSIFLDRPKEYDFWESRFSELYPDLNVYDAGAYCRLNTGGRLISFSHFSKDSKGLSGKELMDKAGQTIILFDASNTLLRATEGFYCKTSGDLGYPTFKSLIDGKVIMNCESGDAGWHFKSTYELDFDTFDFRLINEEVTEPQDYNNY